jgi:hypothetical protein
MKKTIYISLLTLLISSVMLPATSHADEEIQRIAQEEPNIGSTIITYKPMSQVRLAPNAVPLAVVALPCKLELQNIYLRQSFGYGAVGTKATTTCSVPVTSITHNTYIQKSTFFGWSTQKVFSGSVRQTSSYSQLDIGVPCTNNLPTTWTGYTNGIVVYQGVQYYASAMVANGAIQVNCGT